jgi:hypothetical protein
LSVSKINDAGSLRADIRVHHDLALACLVHGTVKLMLWGF